MFRMISLVVGLLCLGLSALLSRPTPITAIPIFSHQYDVTCRKCHSVIPHLNAFGASFMAHGYRIPGVQPAPSLLLATKENYLNSSENQGAGPNGAGLPKTMLDELEIFTAGGIGSRASYFVEQYLVDGGLRGSTRDAWVTDRVNPWDAKLPVSVQAGSFTLPLPVDPETFRESYQDYSLFVQTVGTNPFNFFLPKIGVRVGVGDPERGLSGQVFAGPGHDRQSGIASSGTDTMGVAQDSLGPITLTAYRYEGSRPTSGGSEEFWRTGFGVVGNQWGRLSTETVLQTGWDTHCAVAGFSGCSSSGGFTQLRYELGRRFFTMARYEGTQDPTNGFTRDTVGLFGYAPSLKSRMTIEDVLKHTPTTRHTMNIQYTVAY